MKQFSLVGCVQDSGVVNPGVVDPGEDDAGAVAAVTKQYITPSNTELRTCCIKHLFVNAQ